jgi:hypothetical protein
MKKIITLVLSAIILFTISCKRDKIMPPTETTPKKVYMLTEEADATGNYALGKFYVNGVSTIFANGTTESSLPMDMKINGTDVYLLDRRRNIGTNTNQIILSKNGTTVSTFTNNSTDFQPIAIAIKDNDIYVVGSQFISSNNNLFIRYIKNGVYTDITDNTTSNYATCATFNNNDFYIGGRINNSSSDQPCYWKNGVKNTLSIPAGYASSRINEIIVSGADVYCVGRSGNKPCYWKNGVHTEFATPLNSGGCTGITINGTDVYISGWLRNNSGYQAVYWKNNNIVYLTQTSIDSEANDIALDGNDIYVAGYSSSNLNTNQAAYWKNGVLNTLTTTNQNGDVVKLIIQ